MRPEIALADGIASDGVAQTAVTLRELCAGDVFDAAREAETLQQTAEGYELVQSPTLMGMHLLRRQVARVGTVEGPLTLGQMRLLSARDLGILQAATAALESAAGQAASREVAQRGRSDAG